METVRDTVAEVFPVFSYRAVRRIRDTFTWICSVLNPDLFRCKFMKKSLRNCAILVCFFCQSDIEQGDTLVIILIDPQHADAKAENSKNSPSDKGNRHPQKRCTFSLHDRKTFSESFRNRDGIEIVHQVKDGHAPGQEEPDENDDSDSENKDSCSHSSSGAVRRSQSQNTASGKNAGR